jgi:putative pyruvate formate lyase activating enzyme
MMLRLQRIGCHNINLVTPTHYSAHILKAIDIAAGRGLRLPIVYNTSGWERRKILELLDGVVDIYLPDFKYWDSEMSAK